MFPGCSSPVKSAFSSLKTSSGVEGLRAFVPNPPRYSPFSAGESDADGDVFMSRIDDDVATCVTLEEDGSVKTPSSPDVMNQNYAERAAALWPSAWGSEHNRAPGLEEAKASDNNRRKLYARYHPASPAASDSMSASIDLKNKTRFSATGASGLSSVVRDTKMSLSSSPPSPRPGSLSGNYFKSTHNYYHNHFQPIPSVLASSCKKDSEMSTSPSLSSASHRSSTSSFTSGSSRKRRADDDVHRCSGYSSTSEVAAAVGHVNLHDRLSTGSISPSEYIIGQPHKRSKNDHEEDDDVIFVSYEPGQGVKGNADPPTNPFCPPPNPHPAKLSTKGRKKKDNRTFRSVANNAYTSTLNSAITESPQFVEHAVVGAPPAGGTPSQAASSTRYFLRSCVNRPASKKQDVICGEVEKTAIEQTKVTTEDESRVTTKFRSQRKAKKDKSSAKALATVNKQSEVVTQAEKVKNVVPPRYVPQPTPARSREQPSFKASYEIKGQIGVGGGGVVFAGTRKSDLAEVAIKRVPKDKVRRWGKLDGKNVPLEFELLQRASKGNNKGVIRMYDWYERNKSFILVMERPQPVMDLFDYLNQQGAMKEDLAKKVFRQIVEAVNGFHANGVVHRDIKDENVLLNLHTHDAKVIDFGCGTYLKDKPYTEFAGTPEFYPPEWFRERKYYGKKVDAWSLGVLLYTMVESEVPFPKEKDTVNCRLKFNRSKGVITSSCRHLIEAMLEKDQEKRPTLDEVLEHPWLQEELLYSPQTACDTTIDLTSSEKETNTSAWCPPKIWHSTADESVDSLSITQSSFTNTSASSAVHTSSSLLDNSSSTVVAIKDSPDSPPPPYSPNSSSNSTFYGFAASPSSSQSSKLLSGSSSAERSTIDYSLYHPRPASGSEAPFSFHRSPIASSISTSAQSLLDISSPQIPSLNQVYLVSHRIPAFHPLLSPTRLPDPNQGVAWTPQSPEPPQFVSVQSSPLQVWRRPFTESPEINPDSPPSLFSHGSRNISRCSVRS